jgi:hypothetical protein
MRAHRDGIKADGSDELCEPWAFNGPDFLTAPRGVLFLRTPFTFKQNSLETGCTDVETQTHPGVLGL